MLRFESIAILHELFEGLALTFSFRTARHFVRLDQRFESELNRNSHQVRVLCYRGLVCAHDAQ